MPKSQNIKRYEDVITPWDRASRASLWDRCSTWLSTFQNFWIFKIIKYFLRVISGCAYETFSSIFVQMELQSSTTAVEWETKTEKCVSGLQWLLVVKWSSGQHAHALLRRSEFKSFWRPHFLFVWFEKWGKWLLVVKWSACSRFTPTIRVQILLKPAFFNIFDFKRPVVRGSFLTKDRKINSLL